MKVAPQKILSFIIIFFMIYASGDAMVFAYHSGAMFSVAIFNFVILVALSMRKGRISKNILIDYIALVGLIVVSMLVNKDYTGYTQWLFAGVALLTVCNIDFETFCRQFGIVMLWLCIFSLIGTAIYLFAPAVLNNVPTVNNAGITKNLWVTCIPLRFTRHTFRNYGIFYEPGKFAVYIGIALFIQLYVRVKPSLFYIGIYLFTLLTTRSTTGIIAVLFLACLWLMTNQRNKMKIVLAFAFISIAAYIVILRREWIAGFVVKFDTAGPAAASVNSRLASFWIGCWIGISHFFAGAGAVKSQEIFSVLAEQYFNTTCFANMITYLFAAFGGPFLLLVLLGLWGMGERVYRDKIKALGIVLFFILLYSGQIITYSSCFYVLMFYGWKYLHEAGIIVWDKQKKRGLNYTSRERLQVDNISVK